MKILLALSAAIITSLLLFPPGIKSSQSHQAHLVKTDDTYDSVPILESAHQPSRKVNPSAGEASKESNEIWIRAQKRSQEVQAQLKSMLGSEPAHLTEARKLLRARQRELLFDKILILGEESLGGTEAVEAEKKPLLRELDKEVNVLSAQLDLLARADLRE